MGRLPLFSVVRLLCSKDCNKLISGSTTGSRIAPRAKHFDTKNTRTLGAQECMTERAILRREKFSRSELNPWFPPSTQSGFRVRSTKLKSSRLVRSQIIRLRVGGDRLSRGSRHTARRSPQSSIRERPQACGSHVTLLSVHASSPSGLVALCRGRSRQDAVRRSVSPCVVTTRAQDSAELIPRR